MKIRLSIITLSLLTFWILNSCSSSKETQEKKQETDSLYIFDEIPPEDVFKLESPTQQSMDVYVVQIGAFSNLERAKDFAAQSQAKLNRDIKVEFNENKNLYVLWIHPPFQERSAAEIYRNELWNYEEFKDAWIVTVESKK
jgi:cell division septation protein DedD